jgi:hypothetical protein
MSDPAAAVETSGSLSLSISRAPAQAAIKESSPEECGVEDQGTMTLSVATTSAFEAAMDTTSTLIGS